ncbi:MAG: cupin domain-containing protein [Betaproteobacteria bacterium]|nr:cupin domain-containing protein [Betaproteobacteria bacterium]
MGKADLDTPLAATPFLFHVGRVDESKFTVPHGYAEHSRGYARQSLIDRNVGSVHMGVGVCLLEPGGHIDACVHANEKGIYLLAGELEMKLGSKAFRLAENDYAFVPFATGHALRNVGSQPARWFEMQAPQPKPPGTWQDTFFADDGEWPREIGRLDLEDPRTQFVGHFNGQKPMIRDGSGIRGLIVHRFMEREFGAQHFFMMRGELAENGVRGRHDHAVEEVYLALEGEADIEIEGRRHHLGPGDFAWTGVGTCHAFFQKGRAPFRWIETQAPQFPAQHASRNYAAWERMRLRMKSGK